MAILKDVGLLGIFSYQQRFVVLKQSRRKR
jgi:hypothetical protein